MPLYCAHKRPTKMLYPLLQMLCCATLPGEHTDPSVLLSLPPVPLAVQQRILGGVFIDFNLLIRRVLFSHTNTTPPTNANCSTMQPARILLPRCLEHLHLHNCAHNPSQASEPLGYQHLIHSASKHFSTPAWLNYVRCAILGH